MEGSTGRERLRREVVGDIEEGDAEGVGVGIQETGERRGEGAAKEERVTDREKALPPGVEIFTGANGVGRELGFGLREKYFNS